MKISICTGKNGLDGMGVGWGGGGQKGFQEQEEKAVLEYPVGVK